MKSDIQKYFLRSEKKSGCRKSFFLHKLGWVLRFTVLNRLLGLFKHYNSYFTTFCIEFGTLEEDKDFSNRLKIFVPDFGKSGQLF